MKIKVLRSDRNEVRMHVHSGTLTVLYRNSAGLKQAYAWAKMHSQEVLDAVCEEYHRLKREGA